MKRFRSRLASVAVLAVPAITACNSEVIIEDDWGPPAGYARLTGKVTNSAGVPIVAAEVLVTRCSSPIGGLLGAAQTATDGGYHLTGALPPIGAFPAQADTVRARCSVFVNRSAAPLDSLDVRFAADSLTMSPQVLNLTVP
jgi:hypothetical protein